MAENEKKLKGDACKSPSRFVGHIFATIFAILFVYVFFSCLQYKLACSKFGKLISGGVSSPIEKIIWYHRDKNVIIEDSELLQYFSQCLKTSSKKNEPIRGYSMNIVFYFKQNQYFCLDWVEDWSDEKRSPICYYPIWWEKDALEWHWLTHKLSFHEPRPEKMKTVFDFLGNTGDKNFPPANILHIDRHGEIKRTYTDYLEKPPHDNLGYLLYQLSFFFTLPVILLFFSILAVLVWWKRKIFLSTFLRVRKLFVTLCPCPGDVRTAENGDSDAKTGEK